MKLQPDEVWLRALEAIITASTPRDGHDGAIGRHQLLHALDRADEVLTEFKARFRAEDQDESH